MPFTFLMLPPQTGTTRDWGKRLAAALPDVRVVVAETKSDAEQTIGEAEAAFGVLPAHLLEKAGKLRWLQSPQAAPPAGYYYPSLIEHPVVVTNMREIYNDHIGAHIMAFVLAFARDFQTYIPQQLRREWKPRRLDAGVVHLPEATALIVGVGGIGAEAARWRRRSGYACSPPTRAARTRRRGSRNCIRRTSWMSCCRARISSS